MDPKRKRAGEEKNRYEPSGFIKEALASLRPPENITVSEWADKYRILDEKSAALPGPWRTDMTPYLRGIMDAWNDPDIEEIDFIKPTQVGGTETFINCLGYCVQENPAPCLVVYPTLDLGEQVSDKRIRPMIIATPELREKFNDRSKKLELEFDDMYIAIAGANSAASLASRPVQYLGLDEVDKYPLSIKDESDPISLAVERTKTFAHNRKIFKASTPTKKYRPIWQAWENADCQMKYFVPCPHCGAMDIFYFKQLIIPDRKSPEAARESAYYECPHCKGIIKDHHKPDMLRQGEWRPVKKEGTRRTAFWLNTFYSPWVRIGDIAAEWVKSNKNKITLQNFINSWLAEPWEDTKVKTTAETVLSRQSEYDESVVPAEAILLTGGVDVQRGYLYWTIRAWGENVTSWNIAHGTCETWEMLDLIMNTEFPDSAGGKRVVNLVAIDSGDGMTQDEVYDFCAQHQDWAVPVKGASHPTLAAYRITAIEKPDSMANGLYLYVVDTGQYKDKIAARLLREPGPGSWMVYKGCDEQYANQITAEEKVLEVKGNQQVEVWRTKGSRTDNHYLDCEVYAFVAADILKIRYRTNDDTADLPPGPTPEKRKESWIGDRRGWMR